ncbi:hypothetical protein NXS98_00050 [Fontisphaera persica]|uniref:hypothetical protein n=1 Tax=Fontisphaera persica TaxID=2974023 RepID=UPI0024BF8722|nr:hypothetical protein [Fontisphaera persica]WCJ59545.1 hypothetical protein NXS98_00050 [Fontisphaera persica]
MHYLHIISAGRPAHGRAEGHGGGGQVKPWLAVVLLLALALVGGGVMLGRGFGTAQHDGKFHTIWSENFSRQLWGGEVYPRWLMDLNGGLGSPAFYYYPPVPFYATSLLRPVFGEEGASGRMLGAGAVVALCLSGLMAWGWLRRRVSEWAALAGAGAYVLAPYHLAADLYVRGAYAELWAFAWLPLVLAGVDCMADGRGRARGLVLLACGYGLLVATHLPTTLLFSPVPLVYAWCVGGRGACWRLAAWTMAGLGWGAGLAAVYVLPAMTLQEYISMSALTNSPNLQYDRNFLLTALHPEGEAFRAALFWQVLGTFAVGAWGFVMAGRMEDLGLRRRVVWGVVVLYATLFLMLPLSEPVWRHVPRLKLVQFPWRATAILTLAACWLMAAGLHQWRQGGGWWKGVMLGGMVVLLAGWGWMDYQAIRHFARHHQSPPAEWLTRQEDATEYLPAWVAEPLGQILEGLEVNREPERVKHYTDGTLPLLPRMGLVQDQARLAVVFEQGRGRVVIREWHPRRVQILVEAGEPVTLQVSQFYFPGWKAWRGVSPVEVRPASSSGLMQVDLPAGHHTLRLARRLLPVEWVGWGVTLVSGLAAVLVWINSRRTQPRK